MRSPERDWIVEDDFSLHTADFGGHNQARYVGHMLYWLRGRGDDYRVLGGQAWPWRSQNQIGKPYGYEAFSGYLPDWRKAKQDGCSD